MVHAPARADVVPLVGRRRVPLLALLIVGLHVVLLAGAQQLALPLVALADGHALGISATSRRRRRRS